MALQVIGAGLGRTGTFSLKFALEILGFDPCFHMAEIWANLDRQLPLWLDVIDGRPRWDEIFDGYAATVDYPGCTYWRELLARWPEAKVILTTRSPESWFASVNETVFSPSMMKLLGPGPIRSFMDGAVWGDVLERIDDRDFMADYFTRRNQEVIDSVPPEQLLVFQVKDGWEPLCRFLGVPVPAIPFPRTNSREEIIERITRDQAQAGSPQEFVANARRFLQTQRAAAFGATA
jgi:hypothetical protein